MSILKFPLAGVLREAAGSCPETEASKAREKTCDIWKKVSLTAVTAVV